MADGTTEGLITAGELEEDILGGGNGSKEGMGFGEELDGGGGGTENDEEEDAIDDILEGDEDTVLALRVLGYCLFLLGRVAVEDDTEETCKATMK